MIVHISLFYLNNPDDAEKMVTALKQVPEQNPAIVSSYVGRNWFAPPPVPGAPEFADVAQIITFAHESDATAYPPSAAHVALCEATDHMVRRVAIAEFVQD